MAEACDRENGNVKSSARGSLSNMEAQVDRKPFFIIECVTHNKTKWDPKEQKDVPARLFLFSGEGPMMAPDVTWLQSITRPDSGTSFTTSEDKAMRFDTEDEADERLTSLVLEDGYLPGDLTTVKIEPKEEDEDR